jgi:hypothetical protein
MGHPRAQGEKRYAYLLLNVLQEQVPGTEGASYNPEQMPVAGEIVLQVKNHGTGTHTFQQPDGPFIFTMTGVYVATGELDADERVIFDYGAQRLLNLVLVGWQGEILLKQQIYDVVDGLKALLEPELDALLHNEVSAGSVFEKIDTYEKNLWRKH